MKKPVTFGVEHGFDEDMRTRGCFLLGELDGVEDVPQDSTRHDEVPEGPHDILETVYLIPGDGLVVLAECLLEPIAHDSNTR